MKTKILVLTAIISLGMVFQGCEKEVSISPANSDVNKTTLTLNDKSNSSITIEESLTSNLQDSIDLWLAQNPNYFNSYSENFDFSNGSISYLDNNPNEKAIVFKQIGFQEEGQQNRSIVFFVDNNGNVLDEPITILTTVNGNNVDLKYFNINQSTPFYQINFEKLSGPEGGAAAWGQRTADCMADIYTNHGWASVFASVATAFVPEVAAGYAVACAVDTY